MPPDAISAAIDSMKPLQNGAASLFLPNTVQPPLPPADLKVYIGNIYGRNIEPEHWRAMQALLLKRQPGVRIVFAPNWNDALVCRSRSKTATAFLLDSDADVHVSIDGDILFEPWQIAQIAQQAIEHDMVGGLYITRSRGDARPTSIFETGETISFADDPTPKPVKWLASGFTATHRRVFERLAEDLPLCHEDEPWRFYPFYQPYWITGPRGNTIYLSEDFALSDRALAAGFTPHVAPNIRIYHLGLHPFSLEDMAQKPLPEQQLDVTYHPDGRFSVERFAPESLTVPE